MLTFSLTAKVTPQVSDPAPPKQAETVPAASTLSPEAWAFYVGHASKSRINFVESWNMQMDSLLLFAALFSAVVSALVSTTYPLLSPDSGDQSVRLLQEILLALQSNGSTGNITTGAIPSPNARAFAPQPYAVRVNAVWFASLVVSVSVSFLAILAKQWLFDISERLDPSPETCGRQHQYRFHNIRTWRLTAILASLPVLLHISLLLFFTGLIDMLWAVNETVGAVVTSLVGVTVVIYVGTHMLSLLFRTCPYKSSVTTAILSGTKALVSELLADMIFILLYFVGTVAVALLRLTRWFRIYDQSGTYFAWLSTYTSQASFWRRDLKLDYDRQLISYVDPRAREHAYIMKHTELMDASILAQMVETFPRTEETTELIMGELIRSLFLPRYRRLFLAAGVVPFVAQRLRSIYTGRFKELPSATQPEILHHTRVLTQILTECDEDNRLTDLSDKRMPIYFRGLLEEYSDDAGKSLITLSLCIADAALTDTDHIVFSSYMLRLQLAASSTSWYVRDICKSVRDFYSRLANFRGLRELSSDDQLSLVNTAIYIGTRPVQLEAHASSDEVEKARNENRIVALDTLSALTTNNPTMEHAALQQISWGMWMMCDPDSDTVFFDRDLLVPRVRRTIKLSTNLARYLSPNYDFSAYPHAVLTLLEPLLYHKGHPGHPADESTQTDRLQLLKTLVTKYPLFLDEFRAQLHSALDEMDTLTNPLFQLSPPNLLRLIRMIVRVSLCLAYFDWPDLDVTLPDREQLIRQTLDILLQVCDHNHRTESDAWEGIYSLAYSAASQFAMLQIEKSSTGPTLRQYTNPDDLEFDIGSPESVASSMTSVLEKGSEIQELQEPPDVLRTILSMIALQSGRLSVQSATKYPLGVFRHLFDQSPRLTDALQILQWSKQCHAEATRAIEALQQDALIWQTSNAPPRDESLYHDSLISREESFGNQQTLGVAVGDLTSQTAD
ncbi:hypothetical protein EVJ58_g8557 [Rhodofomes roseus]|uniref:DUF6535 domain-containing protein n=1 Tax=Rhodofomes roseus TaxID=34475 RepID=A0A4Y9XXV3_9APHY|nr:hypothetical protein EVJ58_g8557 [Rhodofomes roseus]